MMVCQIWMALQYAQGYCTYSLRKGRGIFKLPYYPKPRRVSRRERTLLAEYTSAIERLKASGVRLP